MPPSKASTAPSLSTSCSRLDTWWILEVACLLVSIVALIGVIVILKIYNGHTLTSWTFYFSLNTVVAFLGGTIAKSAMLFSVSACVSQGKFSWFKKRRSRLALFKTIDNASRGPLGSIELLCRLRGR
jgi:hypothetical protein